MTAHPAASRTIGEQKTIKVVQGETKVSGDESVVLTTLLGSCVSVCLWDPMEKVGGMNHFLLPGGPFEETGAMCFGVNAMELLINDLIKHNGNRKRFKAKIVGGAKLLDSKADIGRKNQEFAIWFLENEGFEIVSTCLGGTRGRKVRFWPTTGRIQRAFIDEHKEPVSDEPAKKSVSSLSNGSVELFDTKTGPRL
ncbi:chemotaxis protein CheD [Lentibacter sp.]|uniref:chemotaxis protein CheD n=1 Tax=Lentibacter sp. TaxID=2024994 RepID=UPI003F69BACE